MTNESFNRIGVLAKDGICRPFDEKASGFTRSESICCIFLQKMKDSKRVYADVVYTKTNNDGFKKEGSTLPSKIMQQKLMNEFYDDIDFDTNLVSYVEAHATGTKLGDPEEASAIDEVFCKNRSTPLLVGSIKSNMGHAESAAGVASMAKIILAFESSQIAPNINIDKPRSDVEAFRDERMEVVREKANFVGDYIAMNSFGLGGANAHILFKKNMKEKVNHGIPLDNLPRLVLWSGRTETAVNAIFDDLENRALDGEYVALLHNSQRQTSSANTYRGYASFLHNDSIGKAVCLHKDILHFSDEKRPIVWVYSGIGSQWLQMGSDLMKIPIFADAIERCHNALSVHGLNLKEIITSKKKETFESVLNSYVGIIAIEIALTDVLKAIGMAPDYIIGHSVGELGCAYADGCLSVEEAILAAHARGVASNESSLIDGAMAAIGLNHRQIKKILPGDIDIACHNGIDSTTISGPAESVRDFVEKLKDENVFAKEVACSGIPLHSRYITKMGEKLHEKLENVIKSTKNRSDKWLSSTYIKGQWDLDEAQKPSAQYFTRNLLNPVLFEEVCELLPKNALTIEVSPHALLKSILRKNLKDGIHQSLTQRLNLDGTLFLLECIGK